MWYYPLSALINGITLTTLGLLVFLNNRYILTNVRYAIFCFFISFWSYSYFLWQVSKTAPQAFFWCQMLMLGAVFVPASYFHFVIALIGKDSDKKLKIISFLGYVCSIIFAIFNFRPSMIIDLQPRLKFQFWPTAGPLYKYFLIYFAAYSIYGCYLLLKEVAYARGIKRNQYIYIFIGSVLGYLGGATNFPLWYDIKIYPFGNILSSLYVALVGYAIIKYRLMDIQVVIGRATALLVLFGIPLIGFRFSRPFISDNLALAVSFILLLLMLKVVDKTIFQKERMRRDALKKASKDAVKLIYLEPLLYKMNKSVYRIFELEHSCIFRLIKRENVYKVVTTRGKNSIPIDTTLPSNDPLILWLKEHEVPFLTIDKIESYKLLQYISDWMKSYSAALCIPSYYGGELKGFLVTGEPKAGQLMQEDIDVLSDLANETAVAVANAELFEEKEIAHKKIEHNLFQSILSLAQTVDKRDEYTAEHSENVSHYSVEIAKEISLAPERIEILKTCALLHDIGKIGIPDNILKGQTMLTPRERKIIQQHPDKGADILAPIEDLRAHLKIIRHHHEKFDGTGYPDGLKGEGIPLESRILALADTFDALTTMRTYRKARTAREALVEIIKCTYFQGQQFDPVVVEAFLNFLKKTSIKKFLLTDGDLKKIREEAQKEVKPQYGSN